MEGDKSRYFDFSTDDDDIAALESGDETHPVLAFYAKELQRIVGNRNPVVSIRNLLALQAATTVSNSLSHLRFLKIQNAMLAIIAALLAYIAFILT